MPNADSLEQISEVLRLCTVLAYRALDAKILGQPIPPAQAVALAKTARLLQDYGVEWPPLLAQVLRELASTPKSEFTGTDDLRELVLFPASFTTKD